MTTPQTASAAEPELPQALLDMAAPGDDDIVDGEIVDDEPAPTPGAAIEIHNGDVAPIVADDPWSGVDDGDTTPDAGITIPLYQLNRKADGGFYNEDTGETVREIEVVLTNRVNTRAWWPVAFGKGGDQAPACRSDDGIVPNVDRSPAQQDGWEMPRVKVQDQRGEPPAKVCADCPNSKWDGDTPPACTASIEFLAAAITGQSSLRWARLRFAGMALRVARDYWNSFKLRMPARPPMAFVTSITLDEEVTDNGTFLVPKFRRVREIGFAEARPVIDARKVREIEWHHAVATDDRQITGGDDNAAGGPFDDGNTGKPPAYDDDGREF